MEEGQQAAAEAESKMKQQIGIYDFHKVEDATRA